MKLQITVRSYKDEVRKRLLASIDRIAKAEASAAGAPKPPKMEISEGTNSMYNDPALTRRISAALGRTLGAAKYSGYVDMEHGTTSTPEHAIEAVKRLAGAG